MKLKALIKEKEIIQKIHYSETIEIKHIAYNSRKVKKESLFVAIKGFKTDGHHYINEAINQGATVIVCQVLPTALKAAITYIQVADPRQLMGDIASRFYKFPSQKIMITGTTGTNGKTSVTYMLKTIFTQNNEKCGLFGTINNQIGDKLIDNAGRTTPDALEIQADIAEMLDEACTRLFMEVSSHALDLGRVNGVAFDYGIFTNLTQDHLDYHKTFEAYFEAKSKLFFKTQKANIINGDDPWGQKLVKRLKQETSVPVYTYGLALENDYYAKDIQYTIEGTNYTLVTPKEEIAIYIDIPGEVMVYNSMAAIINALCEGIEIQTIQDALATMAIVEGRMERLDLKTPFDIVIDYAHTPDGLEKLLKAMRTLYDGKIYLVFGCNGDRDKAKRPIMGHIAGEYADFVVVTSDNPASEDPQQIMDTVALAVAEKNKHYTTVLRRWDAIDYAVTLPQEGDVLVLAGKGHEKQETMAEENLYYNEWETIEKAVQKYNKKG